MNFPSRVRVVKKIPSTGRVTSTRHSLLTTTYPKAVKLLNQRVKGSEMIQGGNRKSESDNYS